MKIANADKLKKHFESVVDVHLFTVPTIQTIINTFSSEVDENDLISKKALMEELKRFFPAEALEGIEPKTFFAQIMHDIDNAPPVHIGGDKP